MEIVRVENGKVIVETDRGIRVRVISVNDGAVFADINPATGKVLITTSKGLVELWSTNGTFMRRVYCSFPGAQMARWTGNNDVVVQLSNGKTAICRETGGVLRLF